MGAGAGAAPGSNGATPLELAVRRFMYGAGGATLVAALTQPLDVVKTTQQAAATAHSAPQGVLSTLNSIRLRSGLLSLWSGLSPTVVRVFLGAGLYFATLHSLQEALAPRLGVASTLASGALARFLAAGALSPFTVVKTRMENQARAPQGPAGSTLGTLRALAQGEGVATLYSGLLPTLLRDAPYSGLYFAAFTALKGALGLPSGGGSGGGSSIGGGGARSGSAWGLPLKTFSAGLCAGAFATALTHPADVLKTRLQLQPPARARGLAMGSVLAAEAARVLREEGVRGLFTGLRARILKRASSTAFTWTLFEEGMRRSGGGA
jgi:solute carrier family 25 protein 38